ncbi:nuclease domain-containing protein [Collimonas humicola]|uniref:nuclease domain-containing protein n=1 Tax=Collimonas humicola TaxID=2825886 RepID=UPI001B8BE233|nr:nuclease domain-containing protein [Collimonas humicola]
MKRSAKPMRRTAMSHGLTGVLSSSSFQRSKKPKKRIKIRHKPLTKIHASARDQEGTLRFPGVCNYHTDTTVLCHSNLLEDGKGYGIKAPDEKGAYGVSADYLLGLSNEPERDPRTAEQVAVLRSVQGAVEQNVAAMVTVLLKNAGEVAPLRSHLESLTQRISQLQEAYDKVCRKNEEFQNDVLAGSILESAVDAAGDAACKAKQFVERRSMIAEFCVKAATDDGSYPLFVLAQI